MTDEDRALLQALADACEKFSLSVIEQRLSQEDQIEIALVFLDVADRVLKRIVEQPDIEVDR
ncbi:MAG TPA: hypothetical protein VFQ77_11340 [Pseudonocardiaceae bacterium]|jgi:hypothetical protein|nr:hypothetical protein [Pseudonocardiaceae bacterium]